MRLFVAIFVSDTIKNELSKIQSSLQEKILSDSIKWVNLEQLHLTLKFLGDVPIADLEKIKASLAEIKEPSFSFNVTHLGTFPKKGRVKVIWAGINEGSESLKKISSVVQKKLNHWGDNEEKDFSPHITLGRVRSSYSLSNSALFLEEINLEKLSLISQEVKSFSLVRSELKKTGPLYSILETYPLL